MTGDIKRNTVSYNLRNLCLRLKMVDVQVYLINSSERSLLWDGTIYNGTTDDTSISNFTVSYDVAQEQNNDGGLNIVALNSILNGILIPAIAMFGIVGNLLNLVILSARCSKREVDILERGALTVLIALALSDMLFCVVTLPYAKYQEQNKALFYKKDFEFYFRRYGLYFQNVFIKISTWLTCIVGVARYVGICYPLRARIFIGVWGIRIAIVISYVLWFLLLIPLFYTYSIHEVPQSNDSFKYLMDVGLFADNTGFRYSFSCIWSIVGYFIPISILAFCNTCLIRALKQSMKLRKQNASVHTTSHRQRDISSRITLTLVALIVTYMALVSPSEVLYFYSEVMESKSYQSFQVAVTFANVLQTINVSFHFVLYCCVNATFRRTICSFICRIKRLIRGEKPSAMTMNGQSVVSFRLQGATSSRPCQHNVKACFTHATSTSETMV